MNGYGKAPSQGPRPDLREIVSHVLEIPSTDRCFIAGKCRIAADDDATYRVLLCEIWNGAVATIRPVTRMEMLCQPPPGF